jgi:ribosome-binding factor A
VFVSIIGEEAVVRTTFAGLEHAAGFVQRRLGDEIELKNTPRIRFVLDDSVKKSVRISELLRIIGEEKGGEPDQT